VPEGLAALRRGEAIIVVDDEDRENEGDFVIAAEKVTPDAVNFLSKHGRGLVCLAATRERLRALELHAMVADNTAALGTKFTVSIDAATGISTGISAPDRAHTVRIFIDPATRPRELLAGAQDCLRRHGVPDADVDVAWVPGSFEIPLAAKRLARTSRYGAVVCLGCLVQGDTPHFQLVASEVAKGIAQVSLESGVPVIFGIVAAETLEQAMERAGTKAGNRGFDAAATALEMIDLYAGLDEFA